MYGVGILAWLTMLAWYFLQDEVYGIECDGKERSRPRYKWARGLYKMGMLVWRTCWFHQVLPVYHLVEILPVSIVSVSLWGRAVFTRHLPIPGSSLYLHRAKHSRFVSRRCQVSVFDIETTRHFALISFHRVDLTSHVGLGLGFLLIVVNRFISCQHGLNDSRSWYDVAKSSCNASWCCDDRLRSPGSVRMSVCLS